MKKIRAGIIGAAGYTGGELIRLLLHHPHAGIEFAQSRSQAGKPLWSVHTDLLGETSLDFSENARDADVLFLCLAHGDSKKWMTENTVPADTVVIDLGNDFRLAGKENPFVYGLPELQRGLIRSSRRIANPGCFATAIQLAVLPALASGKVTGDVHVSATTGSTGAGQSLSATSHFTWRSGNHSSYKALKHQHLAEIMQSFQQVRESWNGALNFIPYRGAFTRGIHAGIHFKSEMPQEAMEHVYEDYYSTHPFVHLSPETIDVKQVVNTNKCFLHLEKQGEHFFITSVIDNLLKGAAGQAVQNMNIIFNLEETSGLRLKPVAF